jgi:lysophospholipase L1-like esterase
VVGDSFTEGMGMEIEETLPSLLESKFSSGQKNINFINGGLAGTGPFEYGRVLFNIGLKYQPDAVLICFFANDLSNIEVDQNPAQMYQNSSLDENNGESLLHFFLPRTYTLIKGLREKQVYQQDRFTTNLIATVSAEARRRGISEEEITAWQSRISKDLVRAVEEGRFYGAPLAYGLLRPNYLTDALDISSKEAEQKWRALGSILSEIINHSRDLGLEVAVVYLPDRLQYDPDQHNANNVWYQSGVKVRKEWLEGEAEIEVRLKSWANAHGVPFMDLISTFRQAEKENISPLTWHYDNHWTAEGNRVAADAIAQWIKEKHVFSFLN